MLDAVSIAGAREPAGPERDLAPIADRDRALLQVALRRPGTTITRMKLQHSDNESGWAFLSFIFLASLSSCLRRVTQQLDLSSIRQL